MIMMHMLELLTRKLELAVGCMDVDVSGSCDGSTNCTLMSMSTDLVWIVLVSVLVQASERAIPSPSPSRSGGVRHGTSCTCTCTCTRPEASTFNVQHRSRALKSEMLKLESFAEAGVCGTGGRVPFCPVRASCEAQGRVAYVVVAGAEHYRGGVGVLRSYEALQVRQDRNACWQ